MNRPVSGSWQSATDQQPRRRPGPAKCRRPNWVGYCQVESVATVATDDEAHYLCAILNSPITTAVVRPLMFYGKDERDFHKHIWQVSIPEFDPSNDVHAALSRLGLAAEELVAEVNLDLSKHFSALRRGVRQYLEGTDTGREIDVLVKDLLA